MLVRRIGYNRAADLILTGRHVDAGEALRLGVIDRLVPAGEALAEAESLAALIVANSPAAVRAAKDALDGSALGNLDAGLAAEDAAWRVIAQSADRREGIAAFAERRPPRWPDAQ